MCRVAATIDAVLLSYSDTLHLGALPYAMKQFGLSAPVYATEPVYRLGLLTMYDQYLSRKVTFSAWGFKVRFIDFIELILLGDLACLFFPGLNRSKFMGVIFLIRISLNC